MMGGNPRWTGIPSRGGGGVEILHVLSDLHLRCGICIYVVGFAFALWDLSLRLCVGFVFALWDLHLRCGICICGVGFTFALWICICAVGFAFAVWDLHLRCGICICNVEALRKENDLLTKELDGLREDVFIRLEGRIEGPPKQHGAAEPLSSEAPCAKDVPLA